MYQLQEIIPRYLEFCRYQKCLDEKTLKAYRIDLRQFMERVNEGENVVVSESQKICWKNMLQCYTGSLNRKR